MINHKHLMTVLRRVLNGRVVSREEEEKARNWVRSTMLQAQEHGCAEAEAIRSILRSAYDAGIDCECNSCLTSNE